MKRLKTFLPLILSAGMAVWFGSTLADDASEKASERAIVWAEQEYQILLDRMDRGDALSESEKARFEELSREFAPDCNFRNPLDNQGGPDGFGYRFVDNQGGDTATYEWIELRGDPGATWINNWTSHDDGYSQTKYPFGFTFPYYGSSHDSFRIAVNGFIQFTTSSGSLSNSCLPASIIAGPAVFLFWNDLHLDRGGIPTGTDVVGYKNFGDYLVLEFDSIGNFSASCVGSMKFEAILYTDGRIKMQYQQLILGAGATCDSTMTIGVQSNGVAGSHALNYVCNLTGIQAVESLAIWFFPSATGSVSGTVVDDSNNPVPNASVRIIQTGATSVTDGSGNYSFPMVGTGTYDLVARKHGFESDTVNNVLVTESQNTDVDFTLVSQGLLVFTSTDVPLAIPSPGTITSTLTVNQAASIEDIDVLLNITHTYVGDLRISLTSPDGQICVLTNRHGTTGDNFADTIFDDEADSTIVEGHAPYNGLYRPDSTLSRFDDNQVMGEWTLTIEDLVATNTGTLNAWEIYVLPGSLTGGSITGQVSDAANNNLLQGILVEIEETGATRITNADGDYTFGLVVAGTYTMHFSGGLYEPLTVPNVVVTVGQTTTVDAALESAFLIYPYSGNPVPITDNDSSFAIINVPDDFEATGAQVLINSITHTYDGDLDIFIRAPNGTQVELSTDNGGSGENFINTLFDDAGPCVIGSAGCNAAPFTGTYRPEGQLSAFMNTPALGDWTLVVFDDAGADIGTIDNWTLILGGSIGPEGTLSGMVRALSNNQPLAGVNVVAVGAESDSATTDAGGQYSLDLPVDTYTVYFSHAAYCDSAVTNVVITENQTTTLDVDLRNPEADVSVTSITHQGVAGEMSSTTFDFGNTGNCELSFTITDDQPWLSTVPNQGDIAGGGTQQITVWFDASSLAPGDYTGTLTVTHNASGSPVSIPVDLQIILSGAEDIGEGMPTEFALNGNYPNPFNSRTEIRYDLPQAAHVSLVLYNMLGQEVRNLVNATMPAGRHAAIWDGRDNFGLDMTSGLYILRLDAADHIFTGKVMLLK